VRLAAVIANSQQIITLSVDGTVGPSSALFRAKLRRRVSVWLWLRVFYGKAYVVADPMVAHARRSLRTDEPSED
jgi:hypothetical protein